MNQIQIAVNDEITDVLDFETNHQCNQWLKFAEHLLLGPNNNLNVYVCISPYCLQAETINGDIITISKNNQ